MIKIGILPTLNVNGKRPFLDTFYFVSNYVKIIYQNKAYPLGVFFKDNEFDEKVLDFFDGFIIPGGNTIRLYHILTIHYAFLHNKPVLGICMGMQAIGVYGLLIDILKKKNLPITYKNLSIVFYNSLESDFLTNVSFHNQEKIFYKSSIYPSLHPIYLEKTLKYIFKKNIVYFPSIHNFALKKVPSDFKVCALSLDGVIEGIEYKNSDYFIMGVQFHIEFWNNYLFEYFIKRCAC